MVTFKISNGTYMRYKNWLRGKNETSKNIDENQIILSKSNATAIQENLSNR